MKCSEACKCAGEWAEVLPEEVNWMQCSSRFLQGFIGHDPGSEGTVVASAEAAILLLSRAIPILRDQTS